MIPALVAAARSTRNVIRLCTRPTIVSGGTEQQAERDKRAVAHLASLREARAAHVQALAGFEDDAVELATASNAAVDLVRKLDEAEARRPISPRALPRGQDGWDRLAYEARGENREAVDSYCGVIAFIREHLDDYDTAFADKFVELVDKLDPQSPA